MIKIRRRAFVRVRHNDIHVRGAQLDIARMKNVEVRPIDGNALLREYPVANDPVHIAVNCAPTLDAEPVRHGRWIEQPTAIKYVSHWECSVCNSWQGAYWMNYCPNCGAKMDGGTRDVE